MNLIILQTEVIPNWPTAIVSIAGLALLGLVAYLIFR